MKMRGFFAIIPRVKISDKERRKFFRHPIQVPIKLRLSPRAGEAVSQSRDLSLGGLNFIWPKKLTRGTFLDITIPVKEKFFELRAKVVYSREDRKTAHYSTGVRFVDFPSAFKARLAEEVLQILEYQKAVSRRLGHDVSEEEAAAQWVREHASRFPAVAG
jgi:c-di-GMP-binding flagellar brake protein YcgR